MKIKLIVVGKTNMLFVKEGTSIFQKRITNYASFEYQIVEPKKNKTNDSKVVKKIESEAILKCLDSKDYLILLDENGKTMNSRKFSEWLQHKMNLSLKSIVFVVGGAFGFDERLINRADGKLSLSSMTFSHQLIRVIFMEQLYRAFTILNNEKYHND